MSTDPFAQFKATQRESWGVFAPFEFVTTPPAQSLVQFAEIKAGEKVLDVGCGTGVVAVTAARLGAKVCGLDLSPVLIEKARWNGETACVNVEFKEGDVEALPYKDGEFDVVVSQFGHMFAPRPEVATREMLRVLKPGGRIAFSTWPPGLYVARMFKLTAQYMPPPPGVVSTVQWGDPQIIRERLGKSVSEIEMASDKAFAPTLSPQHYRVLMESTVGPNAKFVQSCAEKPELLAKFRQELEKLISEYMVGNTVVLEFLMTRGKKV